MEAFSLLKYWRGAGGGGSLTLDPAPTTRTTTTTTTGTTTIVTAVSRNTAETDEDDNDDGPFFDLEFTVPDEDEQVKEQDNENNNSGDAVEEDGDCDDLDSEASEDENENEGEFKFTLSSGSNGDRTDPNVSLSPSDDLFFKGRLVPIEPSSMVITGAEPNSKPQFPVSLLKSATKFRVLMLKFKKSKSNGGTEKTESDCSASATAKQQTQQPDQSQQNQQSQSKFFTVKFKVEEVPIVSLFTRDNSSRVCNKVEKPSSDDAISDEKRFSKDVMQRYFKMVKPLYIRASKRYGEKLKLSGQCSLTKAGPSPPSTTAPKSPPVKATAAKSETQPPEVAEAPPPGNLKSQKHVNIPAGLRVVCKHLGKSRSASSPATVQSNRRDDSLLQQHDGIQSAILHCKRSFNASRDMESSTLSRSVSDPSHEKSVKMAKECSVEEGGTRHA